MKRCSVVVMTRIQAGTTAQASPALESLSNRSTTPRQLLDSPDNRFAASHTLYSSGSPLSAAARGCATMGIPHRGHTWYLPLPCPHRVSPAASRYGTIQCFRNCHIRK